MYAASHGVRKAKDQSCDWNISTCREYSEGKTNLGEKLLEDSSILPSECLREIEVRHNGGIYNTLYGRRDGQVRRKSADSVAYTESPKF